MRPAKTAKLSDESDVNAFNTGPSTLSLGHPTIPTLVVHTSLTYGSRKIAVAKIERERDLYGSGSLGIAHESHGEQEQDETEYHSQNLRWRDVRKPHANHHTDDGGWN